MALGDINILGRTAGPTPYEQQMSELRDRGYGEELATAMLSEDDVVRRAANVVASGFQQGQFGAINNIQINDLARSLFAPGQNGATKLDEAYEYFGEGVNDFIGGVIQSHANAGAGSRAFGSLLELAKGMSDATGVRGQELAARVMAGYRNLGGLALGAVQYDKNGAPAGFNAVSAADQLMLDSALEGAASALRSRGMDAFNLLEDQATQQGFLKAMDVAARSSALGVDLPQLLAKGGRSFGREVGDHVVGDRTGSPTPGNMVTHLSSFLDALVTGVSGGREPVSANGRRSGRASTYEADPDALLAARSTSPGCDDLARRCIRGLYRYVAPEMVSNGATARSVIDDAFADPGGRGKQLVQAVAKELSDAIGGSDGKAARVLAYEALKQLRESGAVNLQDCVERLAYFDDALEASDSAVARSLRTWARYNSVYAKDAAQMREELASHFSGIVPDRSQVSALVSRTMEQVAEAERVGENPMRPFQNAMETGPYYVELLDEKGHQVKELDVPVWQETVGNTRVARSDMGLSEEKWIKRQRDAELDRRRLDEVRKRAAQLADYEQRERIKAQVKAENAPED